MNLLLINSRKINCRLFGLKITDMNLNSNPYLTLGIEENSGSNVIKKSYLKLVKKYHPDSASETSDKIKFNSISHAYEFLTNEQNKIELDLKLNKEKEISKFENNFEEDTHDLSDKEKYSKWKESLKNSTNEQEKEDLKDVFMRNTYRKFINENTGNMFNRINNKKGKYIKKDVEKPKEYKVEDVFSQRYIHEVTHSIYNQIYENKEIENVQNLKRNEKEYYSNSKSKSRMNIDIKSNNLESKDFITGISSFIKEDYYSGKQSTYNSLRLPLWQRLSMSPERYQEKILSINNEKSKHDELKESIKRLSKLRSKKL